MSVQQEYYLCVKCYIVGTAGKYQPNNLLLATTKHLELTSCCYCGSWFIVSHLIKPELSSPSLNTVNSICVPRSAKEATGALVSLEANDGSRNLVINVEYNQLDPVLRATVNPDVYQQPACILLPYIYICNMFYQSPIM